MPPRPLRVLAVALLAVAACAGGPRVRHVKPQLGPLPPSPERVQVPLAVRYDPAFSRTLHGHGGRGKVVPIGEDCVALLDELVPLVAERFERAPPPPAAPRSDAFVLEPSLEHFDFFDAGEGATEAHAIVLRMSLFEPGGNLVSSWTVEGRAPFVPEPPPASEYRGPSHAVSAELEPPVKDGFAHASENLSDAARRFVAGFRRDSRIDAFLARKAAGEPLVLGDLEVQAAFEDVGISVPGLPATLWLGGAVPVKVRIVNRGSSELRVSGLTARLVLADGRSLHAPRSGMLAHRIEAASMNVLAWKAGFGLAGGIASIVHGTQLRSRMPLVRETLDARALRATTLAPGAAAEGLLYFVPEGGPLPPAGAATLSLWLVDEDLRSARATFLLGLPARPEAAPASQAEAPFPAPEGT